MLKLKQFILDLVKKAKINIPAGEESTIVAQIMPSLEAHLNLNFAQKVSKEDQDIMKGMLLVSPETFNGFEFFQDKIENFDTEVEKLLQAFTEEFLKTK